MHQEYDKHFGRLETTLSDVLPSLKAVIHEHETDFLNLGQEMFSINQEARSLASLAGDLVDQAGGEHIDAPVAAFRQHLGLTRDVFAIDAFQTSLSDMEIIVGSINGLNSLIRDFRRLIRTLQVLGISTRIESARLGSAGRGFTTLADDVETLATKIAEHSERIASECQNLLNRVEGARTTTKGILDGQLRLASGFSERLQENIRDLEEMQTNASRRSNELNDNSAAIAKKMGEMVVSAQFHDITRQKVEHVVEVLEHCLQLLTNFEEQSGSLEDAVSILTLVLDLVDLQVSQLTNAGQTFLKAVYSLLASLEDVRNQISGLFRLTAAVGSTDVENDSPLIRAQKGIDGLLEAMTECASQAAGIGRAMEEVASTVGEMVKMAEDIEEVGSEIELIALNASVRAAHTGEEGRAMGVLAVAIQKLSGDARELTDAATDRLQEISSNSHKLFETAAKATDARHVHEMTDSFNDIFQQLHDMEDGITENFERVREAAGRLDARIMALTGDITFHERVDADIRTTAAGLIETIGSVRSKLPPIDSETLLRNRSRIEALLQKYTMDSERVIHEEMFGRNHTKTESTPRKTDMDEVELFDDFSDDRDDDLGDNVELF
ncbi:MAG: hypothetical protein EOM25_01475 [Deltaproteobacteria bacterium]|nr:hypothetical protein [Deltaproteobacteria bacterium]